MATDATKDSVPSIDRLLNPTLRAVRLLGGSAAIDDLLREVTRELALPPQVTAIIHLNGPKTELAYRLHWARTYLKKSGLIDNLQRGVWSLTKLGHHTESVDPHAAVARVRRQDRGKPGPGNGEPIDGPLLDTATWRDQLVKTLRTLEPAAFERLCQRLLRESGFIEVEVTGRPGDGGIDGNGIIRLAGLISFPVLFQCKRYGGSVGAGEVRDFRGAMQGRADKGLIVTTGGFTKDAHQEATRDGAPPIDLIDGKLLVNKMKELGLGVTTKTVEVVEVDSGWFDSI